MGEPDDPSLFQSVRSKAKALGLGSRKDAQPILPQHTSPSGTLPNSESSTLSEKPGHENAQEPGSHHINNNGQLKTEATLPAQASFSDNTQAAGETTTSVEKLPMPARMKNGTIRFLHHTKDALFYSWINALLIFVPVGIATHSAGLGPEIVFATNAVAIIPLAGLLSHATEAVATRLGDTLGALLNVSFGNAVELILFIIVSCPSFFDISLFFLPNFP